MTKENWWIETAERIVIDYANLSGREDINRAEFRERTIKHISSLLSEQKKELLKEIEAKLPDRKREAGARKIEEWEDYAEQRKIGWNAYREEVKKIIKEYGQIPN